MQRNLVHDPQIYGYHHHIFCSFCETRIARVEEYIRIARDLEYGGYFTNLRNVVTIEQATNHLHGNTQLIRYNTYCMHCHVLLGWQIVESIKPSEYFATGRFFMKADLLMYRNRVTLRQYLFRSANAQAVNNQDANADQDGGANVQDPNNQVGGADGQAPNEKNADQVGGANADKDGGTNEQVPNEQDVGAYDQVGGVNDHDGDVNKQVPKEQNVGANEQNADQDEDANEQNHDQDGSLTAKRRKM
ncbi:hypothetical protein P3S67_009127 [Capsicum chacoense]